MSWRLPFYIRSRPGRNRAAAVFARSRLNPSILLKFNSYLDGNQTFSSAISTYNLPKKRERGAFSHQLKKKVSRVSLPRVPHEGDVGYGRCCCGAEDGGVGSKSAGNIYQQGGRVYRRLSRRDLLFIQRPPTPYARTPPTVPAAAGVPVTSEQTFRLIGFTVTGLLNTNTRRNKMDLIMARYHVFPQFVAI